MALRGRDVAAAWHCHVGRGRRRLGVELAGDRSSGEGCGWCQTRENASPNLVLNSEVRGRDAVAGGEVKSGGGDRVDGGDGLR